MHRGFGIVAGLVAAACNVDPSYVRTLEADGGDSDASADSGLGDAGSHDAGTSDSGSRDSGVPDATVPDASLPAPDPALSIDPAAVASVLHCPSTYAGNHDPVLLVHGTGANADVAWDWGYAPALRDAGFDVCTIDLPSASWEDIPRATEYVVVAIRTMAMASGRSVALVGHSQGSLEIGWALDFFPSVRSQVSDAIYLGAVNHGAAQAATICGIGICRVAAWQMRPGSNLLVALNRDDETPGDVPYTSIYSENDTTAVPPTSVLIGATTTSIQALCPGRNVSHGRLLSDGVGWALVRDALTHDGPADATRLANDVCNQAHVPGVSDVEAGWQETRGGTFFAASYLGGAEPNAEPPLPAYATSP